LLCELLVLCAVCWGGQPQCALPPPKGWAHAGLGTTTPCIPGCGAQTASSTVWLPSAALPGCLLEVPGCARGRHRAQQHSTLDVYALRRHAFPIGCLLLFIIAAALVWWGPQVVGWSLAASPADLPLHTVTCDVRCCSGWWLVAGGSCSNQGAGGVSGWSAALGSPVVSLLEGGKGCTHVWQCCCLYSNHMMPV
jgi:hypothetical protein